MKIAIFTETFLPQINGVVRTIEKIVKYLEDNGHEVLLFTIGEGEDIYSRSRVIRLEGIRFAFYKELHLVKPEDKWLSKLLEQDLMQVPLSLLQTLLPAKHNLVEKSLKEFKPDLIHLATPATLGAIGIYYVDEMKLPSLATFHTDLAAYAPMYQVPYIEEIIKTITKVIYSRTDRVLAPSPSSQKQLQDIGLENVGVFGRGVDSELFNPIRANKAKLKNYDLNPDKVTILYAGRLAEEKSLPELIDAFLNLERRFKNIQLLIVGDGPLRAELEAKLNNHSDDFAFTGIKKGTELAELYASADIFAFPSRTETFGQVVLEAMASALPVVGYDSPGVRDLVVSNQSGLLAGLNNLKFEQALEALLADKDLRLKYGKAGRELSLGRSWDKILADLSCEYQKLLPIKSDTKHPVIY